MELLLKIKELNEEYDRLRLMKPAGVQERGFLFEKFLYELLTFSGLNPRGPSGPATTRSTAPSATAARSTSSS